MNQKGFLYGSAPWVHFLFLLGTALVSATLFSVLAGVLAPLIFDIGMTEILSILDNPDDPAALNALKFMQAMQSTGLFIVPALVYFAVSGIRNREYLFKRQFALFSLILLALLIGVFSAPLIDWIGRMNQQMELPEFLSGLEKSIRQLEDQAEQLTEAFLKMNNRGDLLVNILVIAAIPAIGEELLFRGALQKIFTDWSRNIHVAVFITAFIFSTIHMQFYGFFPRFLLGYLFGYLFYWSGNIWVPVCAHFLNNGLIVILSFLYQQKISSYNIEEEQQLPAEQYLVSAVITLVLLIVFYKLSRRRVVYGKELDEGV